MEAARKPIEALPQPDLVPERGLVGGAPAGNFRPLEADNRARAQQPLPPPPEVPPPPKENQADDRPKPEPPKKPREPSDLPRPPLPEEDPKVESERLIEAGKLAFVTAEYGRAAERFRHAIVVAPQQPLAHFLLAQSLIALGKYHVAVDALYAGLARAPDWPASGFRPLELYGSNVADYSEHLRRLAEALRGRPNDPDLLFLYACQLWFDGRREEARSLFERARRRGADPGAIHHFLRALPEEPVV
jgi:tetratricopeptide (TPR) repeat protein